MHCHASPFDCDSRLWHLCACNNKTNCCWINFRFSGSATRYETNKNKMNYKCAKRETKNNSINLWMLLPVPSVDFVWLLGGQVVSHWVPPIVVAPVMVLAVVPCHLHRRLMDLPDLQVHQNGSSEGRDRRHVVAASPHLF